MHIEVSGLGEWSDLAEWLALHHTALDIYDPENYDVDIIMGCLVDLLGGDNCIPMDQERVSALRQINTSWPVHFMNWPAPVRQRVNELRMRVEHLLD